MILFQESFSKKLIFLFVFHLVVLIRLKLRMQKHLLVQVFVASKGHCNVVSVLVRILLLPIIRRLKKLSVLNMGCFYFLRSLLTKASSLTCLFLVVHENAAFFKRSHFQICRGLWIQLEQFLKLLRFAVHRMGKVFL